MRNGSIVVPSEQEASTAHGKNVSPTLSASYHGNYNLQAVHFDAFDCAFHLSFWSTGRSIVISYCISVHHTICSYPWPDLCGCEIKNITTKTSLTKWTLQHCAPNHQPFTNPSPTCAAASQPGPTTSLWQEPSNLSIIGQWNCDFWLSLTNA